MPSGSVNFRQDWQHTDGKAHTRLVDSWDGAEGVHKFAQLVWDTNTLSWVRAVQASGGAGGGGGDASAANQTTAIGKLDAILTSLGLRTKPSDQQHAVIDSSALPTGAATSAAQTTGNNSLASIDGKTPPLGQALAAGSLPVVLTAAQQAALTPPAAITGFALDATVAKDGTDISAPTAMPAGGSGIRGWLSAIWTKLNGSLAVTGTFWQATQPVSLASVPSHAVTNAGTFAVQVTSAPTTPISAVALPLPSGAATEATLAALLAASGGSTATYKGRVNTFRTPGRAGTAGQKLFALHNATGSTKVVTIKLITVDLYQTVIKAVTVPPPIIRVYRVTVLPTNGTALTKVARDSSLTPSSSITVFGDASADGTSSTTALTATLTGAGTGILTQEFAPRLITAAGYEMFDRVEFFSDTTITLRALEGIVVMLDYSAATQNPITDMWVVGCDWEEA